MAKKMQMTAVAATLLALGQAAVADVTVEGYAKSTPGPVWKNSYGECWRTGFQDSTEFLEECGYELQVEQAADVQATDAGPEVTVVETAAIVKDDEVVKPVAVVVEQITINDVQFPFDSAELTPEYKAALDAANEMLKPHRELLRSGVETVYIVGHTDSQGPAEYNQNLSERRAQAVADYIFGQDPSRESFMKVEGRGEVEPVATNDTEDGRRRNRRVVMEVIKN